MRGCDHARAVRRSRGRTAILIGVTVNATWAVVIAAAVAAVAGLVGSGISGWVTLRAQRNERVARQADDDRRQRIADIRELQDAIDTVVHTIDIWANAQQGLIRRRDEGSKTIEFRSAIFEAALHARSLAARVGDPELTARTLRVLALSEEEIPRPDAMPDVSKAFAERAGELLLELRSSV